MKKLLLAIWLSWLVISLVGCAATWTYSHPSGKYSCVIPNIVPKFMDWPGIVEPLYQSPDFSLFINIGENPKSGGENLEAIGILFAIEADAIPHVVGLWHRKGAETKYYIDKSFMSGGPYTGKLEAEDSDKILTTRQIVKLRTGKDPMEIKLEI